MISTSVISGTGLKKCRPVKRSGRSVAAASRVIEIDEVLVASSADGLSVNPAKIRHFTASLSVAASMTRSASAKSALSVVRLIRASAASAASWVTTPLLTPRPRFLPIVARAAWARAISTSDRMTS